MSKGSTGAQYPRALAVRILTRVLSDRQPLDEALAAISGEVSSEKLRWLQEVCAGTLRWKGRLDSILDTLSLKKKPSGWLRKILLLSSYQIVVQDRISVAAVVSETVDEVKSKEGEAPARFANACLRKVAEYAQSWKTQDFPAADHPQNADWASLPEWLWMKLIHQKGQDWAVAFSQACLERPTLWVRGKSSEWKPDWAKEGPVQNSWQVTESGNLTQKSGFQDGEFIVQDISSQFLISEVTTRIRSFSENQNRTLTALDLCAAPGGKSVGLAWNGFQVTATDRNEHRIPLLKQTISRAAPEIELLPWDQLEKCPQKDLVWVDAPCSGTGIIRRHPDVRWLRQEKEVAELAKTQRALLKQAWDLVLPGGFLVYSVCSVLDEEGIRAIRDSGLQESVLAQWSLSPHLDPHGDGFWAAILRKSGSFR